MAGSGHFALTALVALTRLPDTKVVWLLRRGAVGNVFGGGDADQLPARGALGLRAQEAARAGQVEVVTGFRTETVEVAVDGRLALVSSERHRVEHLDEVVVLTGFRPDLSWLSELRLDLDPVLQAPTALAPLIDPNVHSCGTVYPHGAAERVGVSGLDRQQAERVARIGWLHGSLPGRATARPPSRCRAVERDGTGMERLDG